MTVASILPALEENVIRAVVAMLEERLAVPSVSDLRFYRLGLVEVLQLELGRTVSPDEYDAERARRRRHTSPQSWPSSSQLSHHYGLWAIVNEYAAELLKHGVGRKTPAHTHHQQRLSLVEPDDIVGWIERFRKEQGDWPQTPYEFECWTRAVKLLAGFRSRVGSHPQEPKVRIPTRKAWRRHYPSFHDAVDAARLRGDERQRRPRRRRTADNPLGLQPTR